MNAEDQSNININGKILTISGLIEHLFLLLSFKFSLINYANKGFTYYLELYCKMYKIRFGDDL